MLVELKNGETLNGHLVTCDNWMNLILREVVQTSPEGDRFFKLPEVYIRGNNVCFAQRLIQRPSQSCLNAHNICSSVLTLRRSRSNTSESPKKSSNWSRNNSKTNPKDDEAMAEMAAVTVVAEVVVEVGVVAVAVAAVLVALVAPAYEEGMKRSTYNDITS